MDYCWMECNTVGYKVTVDQIMVKSYQTCCDLIKQQEQCKLCVCVCVCVCLCMCCLCLCMCVCVFVSVHVCRIMYKTECWQFSMENKNDIYQSVANWYSHNTNIVDSWWDAVHPVSQCHCTNVITAVWPCSHNNMVHPIHSSGLLSYYQHCWLVWSVNHYTMFYINYILFQCVKAGSYEPVMSCWGVHTGWGLISTHLVHEVDL